MAVFGGGAGGGGLCTLCHRLAVVLVAFSFPGCGMDGNILSLWFV